jgi:hypothetical protein
VVVPDELDPFDESVRVDFTSLSGRGVGAIHSRLCNRLAHVVFIRGQLEGERLQLSRRIHLAEARYRLKHEDDYKTMKMLDAAMILDSDIRKLNSRANKIDVKAVALDAVIKGYESIIKAASREMSRRGIEANNVSRD